MTTIKVCKAGNRQLDYLVARIEGTLPASMDDWRQRWPRYTADWSHTGPIIERVVLSLIRRPDGQWTADNFSVPTRPQHLVFGPTPLIAAARCYIVSKLGETVEVPEELT